MSIFRSTFKPFVARQIATRQHLLKDEGSANDGKRSLNVQLYTGAKSAWARMVSFTDYKGSDELAKKYILEAGTLSTTQDYKSAELRYGVQGKKAAYGPPNLGNNQYGYRPMPGITQVSVSNKGEGGSIRVATVKFKVSNKAQLDDVEILFMRPGFSVLLEWGWSMYLDTSSQTDPYGTQPTATSIIPTTSELDRYAASPMVPFNSATINPFGQLPTYQSLTERINQLQHKFSGNYDGMIGIVQNYLFELQPDGSYECTITMVSPGDVLDSIKMNRPDNKADETTPANSSETKPYNTGFSRTLDNLIQAASYQEFLQKENIGVANLKGMVSERVVVYLKSAGSGTSTASDAKSPNVTYIPLCLLIDIINQRHNYFIDKDHTFLDIEVPVYGDNPGQYGNGLCLASEDSVSIDPNVCMINNPKATFVTGTDKGFSIKGQPNVKFLLEGEPQGSNLGIIGNIFVSVQKLKEMYNNMIENNKGEVYVYTYLKEVLKEIQYALGGINDFDIFVLDNKVVIIDKNYTEVSSDTITAKKFKLNLIGTNTTVKSYKIASKIFQSQSNYMAVAAQNRENLGGIATATQVEMVRGLSDRLSRRKMLPENKETEGDLKSQIIKEKERLAKSVIDIRKYLQVFTEKEQLPATIGSKPSAYTDLKATLLELNGDSNYRSVMPISFEATMDGISGIFIGNVFTIESSALPREYQNKRVGLIVTKVTHNIQKLWDVTIEAKIILLDQGEGLSSNPPKRGILNYQDYKAIKSGVNGAVSQIINQKIEKATQEVIAYRKLLAFCKVYYQRQVYIKVKVNKTLPGLGEVLRDSVKETTYTILGIVINPDSSTIIPESVNNSLPKVSQGDTIPYSQELNLNEKYKKLISSMSQDKTENQAISLTNGASGEVLIPLIDVAESNTGMIKSALALIPDYTKIPKTLSDDILSAVATLESQGPSNTKINPKTVSFDNFGEPTYSPYASTAIRQGVGVSAGFSQNPLY